MIKIKALLAAGALTAAIAPPVLLGTAHAATPPAHVTTRVTQVTTRATHPTTRVTQVTHRDPCFFSAQEFSDWYNGARWGRSLANIQADVACQGAWDNGGASVGTWNGNPEKARLWPRSDGGQTELYFALDNAGVYHVHDEAWTGDLNVGGGHFRRECEWLAGGGRPAGNPCTPSP